MSKKAPGPDWLHPRTYKGISEALVNIFSSSLSTGAMCNAREQFQYSETYSKL